VQTEITHVFPIGANTLRAISVDNSPEAAEAFATLQAEVAKVASTSTHGIVATWVKTQFSNGKSFHVKSPIGLSFVVKGVLHGLCGNLQFFAVPKGSAPKGGLTYRDLFL
jgi:hypothetical protein